MKLKDLLGVLDVQGAVDFEIIEETYPEEFLPEDILKKYPYARDFEVSKIKPTLALASFDGWQFDSAGASLLIEVTNGGIS